MEADDSNNISHEVCLHELPLETNLFDHLHAEVSLHGTWKIYSVNAR